MNLIWILVFLISLYLLIRGADWFLTGAKRIGLYLGMSPFIVGVTIVTIGTTFPELFTSVAAAMRGVTELVSATVIGSNIANILLVGGISAVIGGKLTANKNLIDPILPLLLIGMVILFTAIWPWSGEEEAVVTGPESILLILAYLSYLFYIITDKETRSRADGSHLKPNKILFRDWIALFCGVACLAFGARFLVNSVVEIAEMFGVAVGIISIIAVALGTSLPELMVSIRAALKGDTEVILGNIIGANIFNSFMVIGIPGLFTIIKFDEPTLTIGIPVMMMATLLFVILGISKRIHRWEGIFFVLFYILFAGKILNIF